MKHEEVKLVIPDSLSEVTLGQYQEYLSAIKDKDEERDSEFINKKLIEAFCGIEMDLVDRIPVRDIESLLEVLKTAFEREYDLVLKFKLLDVNMGFIPKLDEISLGEYIDVEGNITDWHQIHKAMAVLYRPVNFIKGDKYTIAPYSPSEEVSELMKEMPLDIVMGCMVFFYRLGMELSTTTLNFIHKTLEKDTTSQVKTALEKSGVGISQFMRSLKETSESLMKLHHSPFTSA